MREEGYLHISFYPVSSGGSFGGIYFGQGEWVNRDKGWSHLDTRARSADHVAAASSSGGPVSLTGPNQTLLEYLGNPVEPPADMSDARIARTASSRQSRPRPRMPPSHSSMS